jgi:hypothetical protein
LHLEFLQAQKYIDLPKCVTPINWSEQRVGLIPAHYKDKLRTLQHSLVGGFPVVNWIGAIRKQSFMWWFWFCGMESLLFRPQEQSTTVIPCSSIYVFVRRDTEYHSETKAILYFFSEGFKRFYIVIVLQFNSAWNRITLTNTFLKHSLIRKVYGYENIPSNVVPFCFYFIFFLKRGVSIFLVFLLSEIKSVPTSS